MLLRPISEALNRALADSTRAQALCAALAGRVLRVQVTGVAFALNVIVAPDHLELSTDGERTADVTIRGSAIALLGLLLGDASAQLRRGDAELIGDAELAQQFMALAELVRPDTETELARLIGPIGAHLLGRAARAAGGWGRQTLRTLIDNGAEYLAHERGVLIPRAEAEPFLRGVDALRERLDRLEAREGLLRSRLAAVPERGP
jgi:ubiquinone biosynthesis accessory factor UbiJ